jgi:hypothetical protein
MSEGTYACISARLHPGERLIWCGRPLSGIHFRRNQIPGTLVIAVAMALFAIIPIVIAITAYREGEAGGVIFAAFFLLAASAAAGNYVREYRQRGRAAFGLTDRRVIVLSDVKEFQDWSLPLASLSEITLREQKDGSGSIVCFSTELGWNRPTRQKGVLPRPLVASVVDVRHVHDLLLDARSRIVQSPSRERGEIEPEVTLGQQLTIGSQR